MRPHSPAWLPKASNSRSPGLSGAVTGRGSTFLSATNVTFQESSTSSPLESLCFLPETRFFSRHCQQARESRIQPPICARNLFGENKEDSGRKGPEPPGSGAYWGPGWAPRAPLSAPEQRHPPTLPPLRPPGLASHTGKASPASGARARTRVLGLPWEFATGVLALGGWYRTEFCFLSC